jgi:hypothetical protein
MPRLPVVGSPSSPGFRQSRKTGGLDEYERAPVRGGLSYCASERGIVKRL